MCLTKSCVEFESPECFLRAPHFWPLNPTACPRRRLPPLPSSPAPCHFAKSFESLRVSFSGWSKGKQKGKASVWRSRLLHGRHVTRQHGFRKMPRLCCFPFFLLMLPRQLRGECLWFLPIFGSSPHPPPPSFSLSQAVGLHHAVVDPPGGRHSRLRHQGQSFGPLSTAAPHQHAGPVLLGQWGNWRWGKK